MIVVGKLIDDSEQRDAIHIAVLPVTCGAYKLKPGQDIGVDSDGVATIDGEKIGIVDPFLDQSVFPGQRFWMFLYPNTITSLRHDWSHPAVPSGTVSAPAMKEAIEWIKSFAKDHGAAYGEIMDVADAACGRGGSGTTFLRTECEVPDEFWDYYEVIRGVKVAAGDRETYFSCSC